MMGTDEGDLTYMEVARYVRQHAEAGGDWVCVLSLGGVKKIVGRGGADSLDTFVRTMFGDYGEDGSDGFGFSVGRVRADGQVEIPVLCSCPVGAYWDKFDFLSDCLNL